MCDFNEYQDPEGTVWIKSENEGISNKEFFETKEVSGTPFRVPFRIVNANLARPITVAYSWRSSLPWRIITDLLTFDVPNWGPGVHVPAEPKPEVETEEWIEWTEPFVEYDPVVMRVRPETAIKSTKATAANKGRVYPDDQAALDDFLVVNWAAIVRYPKDEGY